jgi:hypothetical protein
VGSGIADAAHLIGKIREIMAKVFLIIFIAEKSWKKGLG